MLKLYIIKFDKSGTAYVSEISYSDHNTRYLLTLDVPTKYIYEDKAEAQAKATALNEIN